MAGILRGKFPLKSYERLTPLGSGSFGAVWKYHKINESDFPDCVAVKECIGPDLFQEEIKTLEQVSLKGHDNLVKCLGIEETPVMLWIILELCDQDLYNYMKENRLHQNFQSIINFCSQVASAIKHLHELGIVHQDIKPQNVLVLKKTDGVLLKVADFGESKTLQQRGTQQITKRGTCMFMSPEMFSAYQSGKIRPDLNPMKSDIFSLGLLFTFIHEEGLVEKIANDRKMALKIINEDMQATRMTQMIMEMLQENPRDRPNIEIVKLFLDAEVNILAF